MTYQRTTLFFTALFLKLQPQLSFKQGGYVFYTVPTETVSSTHDAIVLAAGPLTTFALAIIFSLLWFRFRNSLFLFYLAFWNSVFRFNVIIDGAGSDEWKLSQLIGLPGYSLSIVSFIICIILSFFLVKHQDYFKKSFWIIPLGWIISGIGFRISFESLALIFN